MHCVLSFFSLSKCEKFHQEISGALKQRGEHGVYETFASFIRDLKHIQPNAVIIDIETTSITLEVVEMLFLPEFSFINCVIVSGKLKGKPFHERLFFCKRENLAPAVGEAMLSIFKNQIHKPVENSTISVKVESGDSEIICRVKISFMLTKLGFQPKHIGTTLLKDAIDIICQSGVIASNFNRMLYPQLADKFETNVNNIERNIRNSIRLACSGPNKKVFEEVLGIDLSDVDFPPSRAFIAALCSVMLDGKFKQQKMVLPS